MMVNDLFYMNEAFEEAQKALSQGEIPIGAVLVKNHEIISRAYNRRERSKHPLHHAEIIVLEEAASILGNWRFTDTTLYVTVEPCPMCLGALLQARVGLLVYGCTDPKRTSLQFGSPTGLSFKYPSLEGLSEIKGNNHTLMVKGPILETECSNLLVRFFRDRRSH